MSNFVDYDKHPLVKAVQKDQLQRVKILLQDESLDENIHTVALNIAVRKGYLGIVKELIKDGANVNSRRITKGMFSSPTIVWKTNEHGIGMVHFSTPLYIAAELGYLNIVKELIKAGAFLNTGDCGTCESPLLAATKGGKLNIVKYLLKSGAGYGSNYFVGSPLHVAAENGYLGIVKELLKYGADPFLKRSYNGEDETPLDVAKSPLIKQALRNAMSRLTIIKAKKNHKIACPICMETFKKGDNMALLHKKSRPNQNPHIIHKECIDEWLTNHDTCPLCRGKDLKFGKKRKIKKKVLLTKALKNQAKRYKVKLSLKSGNKRVYKTEKILKKQISNAIKRSN
jgi:hypothetical protein